MDNTYASLPQRQARLVKMREQRQTMTLRQIADFHHLTPARVSKLLGKTGRIGTPSFAPPQSKKEE